MTITDVTVVLLTGPSTNDPFLREARERRSAAFIEIHTDVGVVGLGETYAGYFCPELVPPVVEFFKPILVGQNVDDIRELWRRMYHCGNFWCRVGLGAIVLTGVEAALWDLKGKLENVPVVELLGGCKYDRLLAYATGGPSNYPEDRLAAKVDHYLSLGYNAFKVASGAWPWTFRDGQNAVEFEAQKAAFLRDHVGPDVKILFDGHMSNNPHECWDVDTATAVLDAVAPYDIFLYEEPLHYTNMAGYAELTRRVGGDVPVAGGECLTAMCEWEIFANAGCFDIAQPDAAFSGGLTVFMDIADIYHRAGKSVVPHCWGAGGSLMQTVHCAFAAPNIPIVEVPPDFAGLHADIIGDRFQFADGYVLPPTAPGLGIELTPAIKERYPFVPDSGEYNSVPGKILKL